MNADRAREITFEANESGISKEIDAIDRRILAAAKEGECRLSDPFAGMNDRTILNLQCHYLAKGFDVYQTVGADKSIWVIRW